MEILQKLNSGNVSQRCCDTINIMQRVAAPISLDMLALEKMAAGRATGSASQAKKSKVLSESALIALPLTLFSNIKVGPLSPGSAFKRGEILRSASRCVFFSISCRPRLHVKNPIK